MLIQDMVEAVDQLKLSPWLQALSRTMGENELYYAVKDLLCLVRERPVRPGVWQISWRLGTERYARLLRLLQCSAELSAMFAVVENQLLLATSMSDQEQEAMLAPVRAWTGFRGHLFVRPKDTIPEGDELW